MNKKLKSQAKSVESLQGHCLCGAVALTVIPTSHALEICHCSQCRRWGGGPLFCLENSKEVNIKGEDAVTRYASSEWAERAFCKNCGTHLFYRLLGSGDYSIPPGLFGEQLEGFALDTEIYIDSQPDYYSFAQKTKRLTGAQVEEMFTQMLAEAAPDAN